MCLATQSLMENRAALELLALSKRLYWWVESSMALPSWHLAYLVTWATCLVSHLLQSAFEHTDQLAQTQDFEASEPLFEFLDPEPRPVLTEPGALGE